MKENLTYLLPFLGLIVFFGYAQYSWNTQGEMQKLTAQGRLLFALKKIFGLILGLLLGLIFIGAAIAYFFPKVELLALPRSVLDFLTIFIQSIHEKSTKTLKKEFWLILTAGAIPPIVGILYFFSPPRAEHYGKAAWGEKKDVTKGGLAWNKGFILAKWRSLFSSKLIGFTKSLCLLVVAPPGAGKTVSIIVPNLLRVKNTSIVLDVKGELTALTAGYRQKMMGHEIYIFNPFGSDSNFRFNPFDRSIVTKLGFPERQALAREVANTIFTKDKDSKSDDHWRSSAINVFVFFAMFYMSKDNHATLHEIHRGPKRDWTPYLEDKYLEEIAISESLGQEPNIFRIWLKQVEEDESLDDSIRDTARQFRATPPNEFGSVLSTFSTKTILFSDNRVKNLTDSMSFHPNELREKRITLYIKSLEKDIETLAPIIRIMLDTITKNLMCAECKDPTKWIYFYLDEFIRFGKMDYLLEAPALSRSYGLIYIYITQSYAYIRKHYSEDDLKILLETVSYQVVFKMNSSEAAEMLAKDIGDFTAKKTTRSDQGKLFGSSNVSDEARKLVTAQDILNLNENQIIVLATGAKARPFLCETNPYFKNKNELKKTKINFVRTEPKKHENKSDRHFEEQVQRAKDKLKEFRIKHGVDQTNRGGEEYEEDVDVEMGR